MKLLRRTCWGYLSGFFAGDGCVRSDLSGLRVIQSSKAAEVLFLYASCFGGSRGVGNSGSGTSLPCLHWQVSGVKARRAAEMLGKAQLEKQVQLLQFVRGTDDERQTVQMMMRLWKQVPTAVEFQSWSEVAGFVDVEGCFAAKPMAVLTFHQKHRASLEGLQRFLFGQHGIQVYITPRTHDSTCGLTVSRKAMPQMCQELLQAGLLQKRTQAGLALGHTTGQHLELRSQASGAERESRPIPPDD